MNNINDSEEAKIAIVVSPGGIEMVSLISKDRAASLRLYSLIASALEDFAERVKQITNPVEPDSQPLLDRGGH